AAASAWGGSVPLAAAARPRLPPYAARATASAARPISSASRRRRGASMGKLPAHTAHARAWLEAPCAAKRFSLAAGAAGGELLEDDLDATVLRPPLRRRVARDRVGAAVAGGGDAVRIDPELDQPLLHGVCPALGETLVAGLVASRIGVAVHLDAAARILVEHLGGVPHLRVPVGRELGLRVGEVRPGQGVDPRHRRR